MIKEYFEEILQNYEKIKEQKLTDHQVFRILTVDLPNEILAKLNYKYLVKGSRGQFNNLPTVPYIAVMKKNITTSPQRGYYIIYLFDEKMEGIYLSFNQGVTQYEEVYDNSAAVAIRRNSERLKSKLKSISSKFSFDTISLNATQRLGEEYELGHICGKYYPAGKIPEEEILIEDLKELIKVYEELFKIIRSDILNLDADLTLEEKERRRQRYKNTSSKNRIEMEKLRKRIFLFESGLSNESEEDIEMAKEALKKMEDRKS